MVKFPAKDSGKLWFHFIEWAEDREEKYAFSTSTNGRLPLRFSAQLIKVDQALIFAQLSLNESIHIVGVIMPNNHIKVHLKQYLSFLYFSPGIEVGNKDHVSLP